MYGVSLAEQVHGARVVVAKCLREQTDRGAALGERLLQVRQDVTDQKIFFYRRGQPNGERFDGGESKVIRRGDQRQVFLTWGLAIIAESRSAMEIGSCRDGAQ